MATVQSEDITVPWGRVADQMTHQMEAQFGHWRMAVFQDVQEARDSSMLYFLYDPESDERSGTTGTRKGNMSLVMFNLNSRCFDGEIPLPACGAVKMVFALKAPAFSGGTSLVLICEAEHGYGKQVYIVRLDLERDGRSIAAKQSLLRLPLEVGNGYICTMREDFPELVVLASPGLQVWRIDVTASFPSDPTAYFMIGVADLDHFYDGFVNAGRVHLVSAFTDGNLDYSRVHVLSLDTGALTTQTCMADAARGMPSARKEVAIEMSGGCLIFAGGEIETEFGVHRLTDYWTLDLRTYQWRQIPSSMPIPLIEPRLTTTYSGNIYLWGDFDQPLPGMVPGTTHLRILRVRGLGARDSPPSYYGQLDIGMGGPPQLQQQRPFPVPYPPQQQQPFPVPSWSQPAPPQPPFISQPAIPQPGYGVGLPQQHNVPGIYGLPEGCPPQGSYGYPQPNHDANLAPKKDKKKGKKCVTQPRNMAHSVNAGHSAGDIYNSVIRDVIAQVKEAFLDESIDVEVLAQLQQEWESKVRLSGRVDLDGKEMRVSMPPRAAPAPATIRDVRGPPTMVQRAGAAPRPGVHIQPTTQELLARQQHLTQVQQINDQRHANQVRAAQQPAVIQQAHHQLQQQQMPMLVHPQPVHPSTQSHQQLLQQQPPPQQHPQLQHPMQPLPQVQQLQFLTATGGMQPMHALALPMQQALQNQLAGSSYLTQQMRQVNMPTSYGNLALQQNLPNPLAAGQNVFVALGGNQLPMSSLLTQGLLQQQQQQLQQQQRLLMGQQAGQQPGGGATGGHLPQVDGNAHEEDFGSLSPESSALKQGAGEKRKKTKKTVGSKGPSLTEAMEKAVVRRLLQMDGGKGGAPTGTGGGGGGGMSDSSSEEEEEDDDPLRRMADRLEDREGANGEEADGEGEDPLNSEDDQSDDEDMTTLFDAEHIIMCQFEKVSRARNKWKFTLKDGIMHINGKDFCFQKCTGEAEW